VAQAVGRSVAAFREALTEVDVVWLFGPYPLAFVFAAIARARGVRVVLGVRQDLPSYVANRHPGRRAVHLAATALEHGYRRLARRHAAVVVGPDLARNYADAGRLLDVNVSLIRAGDVAIAPAAPSWEARPALELLSVGRLDAEKNPAMLADVLAGVRAQDPRWRLTVCGEGGRRAELEARAAELGVGDHVRMLGYVAGEELAALYRASDAFLHVSWTEGVPQVLFEAFAAGLPVVGTAVGGVRAVAGDAALLAPPGDPGPLVQHVLRLGAEPGLRHELVRRGARIAWENTLEAESGRVAEFLGVARPPADLHRLPRPAPGGLTGRRRAA
jgi:glycosyltransferase involved in cell wall biosynthesis